MIAAHVTYVELLRETIAQAVFPSRFIVRYRGWIFVVVAIPPSRFSFSAFAVIVAQTSRCAVLAKPETFFPAVLAGGKVFPDASSRGADFIAYVDYGMAGFVFVAHKAPGFGAFAVSVTQRSGVIGASETNGVFFAAIVAHAISPFGFRSASSVKV